MAERKRKAVRPLVIGVPLEWELFPSVQALGEKGHEIVPLELENFDLVLGPNMWRLPDESYLKDIDLAVKAVRAKKYPTAKGDKA